MDIGRIIMRTPGERAQPLLPARTRRSLGSRLIGWLESVLFVAGIACLGYYAYVAIEARLYQEVENRELDIILSTAPKVPQSPGRIRPPQPLPGSAIGRIEIPRLGVSAVIRAGSDAKTLRLAVGHIPGTALPGEVGNIGLAGHRDTFFRRLRDIRATDDIRVVTTSGTFTFKVNTTTVVSPKDTWVLNPTRSPTLTLVTCYPFTYIGSAPQRFIVHAAASVSAPASPGARPPLVTPGGRAPAPASTPRGRARVESASRPRL
jgi:sortase A